MTRILIDLDGPSADWSAGVERYFFEHGLDLEWLDWTNWNGLKQNAPEYAQGWVQQAQASRGFYRNLPLVPGVVEAVGEMIAAGHDVWLCSTPDSLNESCASDKIAWVAEHFGLELSKRVILTRDKTLVDGDILIDDKPFIIGADTPPWQQVVFYAPYNEPTRSGDHRPRLVDWKDWREAIDEAIDTRIPIEDAGDKPNARLIGIGGLLASGKDTVADHLVADHDFVKVGMSDLLNECLIVLNPIIGYWPNDTDLWRYSDAIETLGYVEAKRIDEVRDLLVRFGTDVGRDLLGENLWVDVMRRRLGETLAAGQNVIVTGIRFPNELALISSLGGGLWWVDRPGGSERALEHASENSVTGADFDITLVNNGSIEDLGDLAGFTLNSAPTLSTITLGQSLGIIPTTERKAA